MSRTIEHSRQMEEKLASSNKVNEYLNSLLLLRGAGANGSPGSNGSPQREAASQEEGKIVKELQTILKTDRDLQERVSFVPKDGFAPMHLRE